jgi:lipid-A-disaccharide synthase
VSNPIRILLSSGEASGDLYVGELLRALRKRSPSLEAFGLGGARSKAEGARLVVDLHEISVIGLVEVVRKVPALRRAMSRLLEEARARKPDVAVLVDFSGFHLRLAKKLHDMGVPILYYVSPQVWAWRRGRIRRIRELVDEMLVILPFEEELYRKEGVPVRYVGHPLVDLVEPTRTREEFCADLGLDPSRPILFLLPGSRRREIELHVLVFRDLIEKLARERPELQIVVSRAPTVSPSWIEAGLGEARSRVRILESGTYDGLKHAAVAVVASGTATVEAALCDCPMVVVYRVGRLTYALGRRFVRVPHFSMVNLIGGRRIVPELIQDGMTAEAIAREVEALLEPDAAEEMRRGLREVRAKLGGKGASTRAAEAVLSFLEARSAIMNAQNSRQEVIP